MTEEIFCVGGTYSGKKVPHVGPVMRVIVPHPIRVSGVNRDFTPTISHYEYDEYRLEGRSCLGNLHYKFYKRKKS